MAITGITRTSLVAIALLGLLSDASALDRVFGITQRSYTFKAGFSFDQIELKTGSRKVLKAYKDAKLGEVLQGEAEITADGSTFYFGTLVEATSSSRIYAALLNGTVIASADFEGGVPHFHFDKDAIWALHVQMGEPSMVRLSLDLKNRTVTKLEFPKNAFYHEGLSAFCPSTGTYAMPVDDELLLVNVRELTVEKKTLQLGSADLASIQLDCNASPMVAYSTLQTVSAPRFAKLNLGSDKIVPETLMTFDATITDAAVTSLLDMPSSQFLQVVINGNGHPLLAVVKLPTAANQTATATVKLVEYAPMSLFGGE